MENNTDQVSTKEFLKSVFNYFKFLGSRWQLLLIVLVAGNLYDMVKNKYFSITKTYGAAIQFNIDLEGNAQNQLGGLASAFMGNVPSNSGLMDISNFPLIITSRTVFENALMTETELFGRKVPFCEFFLLTAVISGLKNGVATSSATPLLMVKHGLKRKSPLSLRRMKTR
ncbi:MAG: hypothetical protein LRY55_02935 [Leadbetterella sp.]|nr:hypothetical protein [Leadbetterella sp.]